MAFLAEGALFELFITSAVYKIKTYAQKREEKMRDML
jgi:hypothetical protein